MSAAKVVNQATPGLTSFLKIAIFWFILLHVGTIVFNSAGASAKFLPHLAAGGFAIHSLLAISLLMAGGSSTKFLLVIFTCVIAGFGIFGSRIITRGMDASDTRQFVTDAATDIVGTLTGTNRAFRRMGAVEHLAEAARLIFEEESTGSLEQAQRHLRAITPSSPQYHGARRLLDIARNQAEELENTRRKGNVPVIQILRREQKDDAIVITLRNNGEKPVKNIAYHIAYFEARTGLPLGDEMRSRISNVLNPQETQTIEIPARLAGAAHAAFSLVDWEDVGS